jgi:hypothetical protein
MRLDESQADSEQTRQVSIILSATVQLLARLGINTVAIQEQVEHMSASTREERQ